MSSCCHDKRNGWSKSNHHRGHCFDFEKPLVLVKSVPFNGQTGVSPNINSIKLVFSRDFDNDPGWHNVLSEIDMWQGSNRVPIRIKRSKDGCDGQKVILVVPVEPLLQAAEYKVRVKSFFVDENGENMKRINLIAFTTGCR